VWTLEQAHYLLAQMHRRNLDLKAATAGTLDANEINGLNFDVLRTLIEVGVTFDDAARFNNSLLRPQKRFDAERMLRLQRRRDELADDSFRLNRDIARLGRESAVATSQDDKDNLAAQIAELTSLRDANDKERDRLDKDIGAANGPSGEVQATEPPPMTGANRLPESSFDDSFKEVTKTLINRFNEAPKLNAALRLDNFLQLQYEIIAKQLTLLRDEVGPGERIIFLEMPQSVNTTHDKAEKKWAQSWWKVAGYTTPKDRTRVVNTKERSILRQGDEPEGEPSPRPTSSPTEATSSTSEPVTTRKIIQDAMAAFVNPKEGSERVRYIQLQDGPRPTKRDKRAQNQPFTIEDRSVRTIDLIPRQGSLNVNDIKLRVKSGVLTAVARTLFGFGASLNVQRQRENFSQFVQQELYSSSFGKGAREFGWTYAPMPGTDRILSGTKTTYAVMVVPNEAEALVMYSNGCYFPRAEYQPIDFQDTLESRWSNSGTTSRNCSGSKAFVVPIPGGGDENNYDFHVDGLEYVPADKADRVTLLIYGRNFPAQLGVLVDGIPLTQSIGVAQPLIRDDSEAFAKASEELKGGKVLGRFERIDPNQIVAVFERPSGGKDGVQPVLTLTAPGKAKTLNTLRLYINGTRGAILNVAPTPLLFGRRPADEDPFRIDKVEIFKHANPRLLVAAVTGAGFRDASGQRIVKVLVNGGDIPRGNYLVDSASLLRVEFRIPADDTIKVSLFSAAENVDSSPLPNPGKLRVSNVAIVTYQAETEVEPGTLVVKIEGSGFSDDVMAYLNQVAAENALEVAVKSSTEAILKIRNPETAAVVILRDNRTGQETKTIITRKGP
jgi:hypothetical protein